jgi:hypothetical protein
MLGPAADPFSLWAAETIKQPFLNSSAAWFYHVTRSSLDLCWTMPKDILRIRYEDLVVSPRPTLEQVANFLGVQFPEELAHHLGSIKDEPTDVDALGYSTCQAPGQKIARFESELSHHVRTAIAPLVELPMALLGYTPDPPLSNTSTEEACIKLGVSPELWLKRLKQETNYFETHRNAFNPPRLFRQPPQPQPDDLPLLIDTVVTSTQALQTDGHSSSTISSIRKQDRSFEFSDTRVLWPKLAPLLNGQTTVKKLKDQLHIDTDLDHLLLALHQRGFLSYRESN